MNAAKRWRKRLLFLIVACASTIAIIGALAPWIPVGFLPEVQFISIFLPYSLPLWIFWSWRIIRLSAWKGLWLAIPGLLICLYIGAKDFTFSNPEEKDAPIISVLSFNVGTFDFDPDNIHRVGELVKKYHPDIVVMQEFRNQDAGDGRTAMRYISTLCELPHNDFIHLPYHVHGAAIFSKYPITGVDTLFLPEDEINSGILTTLDTDFGPLAVANVHLTSFHIRAIYEKEPELSDKLEGIRTRAKKAISLQQKKVDAILAHLENFQHPVVIAGDFNATPHSRIVNQVSSIYQDSFLESGDGNGWSFKVAGPLGIRIDYQFASHNLQSVSHQVIKEEISDHFPLLVSYQLVQ